MSFNIPFFKKKKNNLPEEIQKLPPDHIHTWELIAKTIVEPKNITIPNDPALTKIALTGMTTYIFQCIKCGSFQKQESFGLEESALDRLMDKVDVGGPEYILRDNRTYILMRRPDNPQTIPVR